MSGVRSVLTDTLRAHRGTYDKANDGWVCGECRQGWWTLDEFEDHLAGVLLGLSGVAVVDAEVYRVARKGLVDLTEAWAELRMDTPEDQSLHDRLVAISRTAAGILPLPKERP